MVYIRIHFVCSTRRLFKLKWYNELWMGRAFDSSNIFHSCSYYTYDTPSSCLALFLLRLALSFFIFLFLFLPKYWALHICNLCWLIPNTPFRCNVWMFRTNLLQREASISSNVQHFNVLIVCIQVVHVSVSLFIFDVSRMHLFMLSFDIVARFFSTASHRIY